MEIENQKKTWLNIRRGDRVLLAIFSPLLTTVIVLLAVRAWQRLPSSDLFLKIIKAILLETFTAIALLGILVSTWVIAKPDWARDLLEKQIMRTLFWSLLLGAVIVIMVFLAVRHT